jgi:hypothetical protein
MEPQLADAKQLHGHRYARMHGLNNVTEECLLAATAQNMKKIALLLSRRGPLLPPDHRLNRLRFIICHLTRRVIVQPR